jgi:hypothetical protein
MRKNCLALTVQRMSVKACSVPEEPLKRERDLPVQITFGSRRESPGVSQDATPKLDKVGYLAARLDFQL